MGIMAQKKGVHSITVVDVLQTKKKCATFSVSINIHPSIDQHLHYIEDLYYKGPTTNHQYLTHTYCFKVY